MIVADSNVLAALCWNTAKSEVADHLFRRDGDWHAPILILSEIRSVARKYLDRKLCSLPDCGSALKHARSVIRLHALEESDEAILRLARDSNCSVYDCEFVHLADQLSAPLLTWDQQLLRAFPSFAITPEAHLG